MMFFVIYDFGYFWRCCYFEKKIINNEYQIMNRFMVLIKCIYLFDRILENTNLKEIRQKITNHRIDAF